MSQVKEKLVIFNNSLNQLQEDKFKIKANQKLIALEKEMPLIEKDIET